MPRGTATPSTEIVFTATTASDATFKVAPFVSDSCQSPSLSLAATLTFAFEMSTHMFVREKDEGAGTVARPNGMIHAMSLQFSVAPVPV